MKIVKLWLPVALWCGLIFYLSSIPGLKTELGILDLILRKIAHMTEYFVLVLLIYRAMRKSFRLEFGKLLFWSSFAAFLYAISDEYHQTFVATRCGNVFDVMIDSVGIAAAVVLYIKKGRIRIKDSVVVR
jgi:VanZ family protein